MSRSNIAGAIEAVAEHIRYVKPSYEAEALEAAYEALDEYIDSALIYTSDILDLWDGDTHYEVDVSAYKSIMEAVTASTFFQLRDEWEDAIYDGIDKAIQEARDGEDHHASDRDDLLHLLWA